MTFCFGHWLSAQATSDPTWQSDVAKLRPIEKVTDKIQPGPIRCFTWAEPNNSAYLCFFLSVNFWLGSWAKPNIAAFLFSRRSAFLLPFLIWAFLQSILDQVPGHPIRSHLSVFFCFFPILKDPLVKWDQVCCLGATRQFSICATTNNLIQTEPITHKFSNNSQIMAGSLQSWQYKSGIEI